MQLATTWRLLVLQHLYFVFWALTYFCTYFRLDITEYYYSPGTSGRTPQSWFPWLEVFEYPHLLNWPAFFLSLRVHVSLFPILPRNTASSAPSCVPARSLPFWMSLEHYITDYIRRSEWIFPSELTWMDSNTDEQSFLLFIFGTGDQLTNSHLPDRYLCHWAKSLAADEEFWEEVGSIERFGETGLKF